MTEWKKGHVSDTKYPKKPFEATLIAAFPSETDAKGTPLLKLDFEGGTSVSLFGIKISEDDTMRTWGGLDMFLDSLNKQGYQDFWAIEHGVAQGFKTEPDITGCKLSMKPIEEQTTGADNQTETRIVGWIAEKITRLEKTLPARPQAPPRKPPQGQVQGVGIDEWKALLIEMGADAEPMSAKAIFEKTKELRPGDAGKPYHLARNKILTELATKGELIKDGDTYQLIG